MLLDRTGLWLRHIPESVIPGPERHCVVDASWMQDGQVHEDLRRAVGAAEPGIRPPINRGSTPAARQFTLALAEALFRRLTQEPGPWNLMRVIDEVSLRTVIEHTLKAPVLLPSAVRIRELTRARTPRRDDYGDVLAYFTTSREPEFEDILGLVPAHPDQLPAGGLAWHLVNLTQAAGPVMTRKQLIAQLGMLVISYESTSAMAASLIGMLLQYGLFEEARHFAAEEDEGIGRLVDEGGRRGISFPFNAFFAGRATTLGGLDVAEGEPVVISYQAANMDTDRYGPGAAGFGFRSGRLSHLAYGVGIHRCQGEQVAKDVTAGILQAAFNTLPPGVRLGHDGEVLREHAGPSWAIAELPVSPGRR
jgi:cytochrome P450